MSRIEDRCGFCGKSRDDVRRLIAGPGVFICDECVRLCNEIINEPPPAATPGRDPRASSPPTGRRRAWWRRIVRVEVAAPG